MSNIHNLQKYNSIDKAQFGMREALAASEAVKDAALNAPLHIDLNELRQTIRNLLDAQHYLTTLGNLAGEYGSAHS